jgi:signal transduction histidine kinase
VTKQWNQTVYAISVGVLIMAKKEPYSPLYMNPALKKLLKKFYPDLKEFKDCVSRLTIKLVKGDAVVYKSLIEFKDIINNNNSTHYLDNSNDLIEVSMADIIFEKEEALLVAFTDSNSLQKVEKLCKENKLKTSLVSTISHELRTPVTTIMNTLDLISRFIPTESLNLLEMPKECCTIIVSHINDLTVIHINKV